MQTQSMNGSGNILRRIATEVAQLPEIQKLEAKYGVAEDRRASL